MIDVELTFRDDDGHLLVIMPPVINRLLAHRQLNPWSKEAAGVLIGERRGPHLVIQDLSEPGRGDIRSRYAVDRCSSHHQSAVDEAFVRSLGTLQYLGEWHTHPEDFPSPSAKDTNSWHRHIIGTGPFILIIVGREKLWVAKKVAKLIIPLVEL